MRIAALSPRAAAMGLESGLSLADARGRISGLVALPYDPVADATLLNRLVRLCITYSPSVAADPPQALLLDITGCAHLHGGEAKMRQRLSAQLKRERLTARIAIADTPDMAQALARFDMPDMHALPIEALRVEGNTHQALDRAGFRTISELASVPRASLAARFGAELVTLLDRLLGHEDPHIVPQTIKAPVVVERRFAEPISRTDAILEGIEAMVRRAAILLAERGEGGRAFAVRLHRSDGHIACLTVETGAPTREPALVLRLLRDRIESLADPIDPGFGYDSIDLVVRVSEALNEQQSELRHRPTQKQDVGPLLDRLVVRYGAQAVLRLAAGDSHIPERAGFLRSAGAKGKEVPWLGPMVGEPPLRPLLLFDPPQRIEVLAAVPDGPPRRFVWRRRAYSIQHQEGPERIACEWWRRRGGHAENPGLTRDYYRVEDETGHRFWLFRYGLYERETAEPRWYVHGLFA